MPKKHKSGGKKGTTPPNRKSFKLNDSFVPPDFNTPKPGRAANGNFKSPNSHFSLRDEVLNTERHHEQWTPAKRLRDHTVSFVSAGSIQPLEEAEIDEPAVIQPQSTEEDAINEDLDDLEAEDGAMASMKIAVDTKNAVETVVAETETSIIEDAQQEAEAQAQAQAQSEVEDMVIADEIPLQEAVHEEETMEDASASLFFVDTAGDDALAFKGPRSTTAPPRPASPTPSDSSEEVVFRGRGVTVRDDPPVPKKTPAKPTTGPADGPLDALARAIDAEDTQALAEATKWGYTKPPKEEPKHWAHADGSVSHQQTVWPTSSQPRPRLDEHFSAIKPSNRKSKKTRKKQNKLLRQELDPEDDFLQDYIDNMAPEDKAALLGQGDDSADDLFNKLLDEIDPDDNLNPTERGPIEIDTSSGSDAWSTDNGEDDDEDDQDMDFDEDEEDDDDEDMDSSDLEDHLDYSERQQWEDEADLRQRQQDAMTDEELARIFAKQEELGLGGDEMLLFDDSGFGDLNAARAGLDGIDDFAGVNFGSNTRNKNGMRKTKRGRKSDQFPDASLMADVLEEDPYGGFDVMDFDRPSLKVKPKGRKSAGILPEELGLSDEELISEMQSAWANDRSKKASRKAEREELRSLGLLGSGGKKKKGNKFKPDLSVRYEEGISMSQVRVELRDFLDNEDWSTKAFPPMLKQDRKMLHEIANYFNLKSKSVGSGKNRAPVLIKTTRTIDWSEDHFHRASSKVARGFFRQPGAKSKTNAFAAQVKKGRGGGAGGVGSYADGQVVGAGAQEIGASNFGRKLMEKMGWQAGMALGKEGNTGLLVPVEARIKSGKGGLG